MIAPANTGSLTIRRTAVMATDQRNKGKRERLREVLMRDTIIVVKKLILPRIEEIPARCNLKIARSTEIPVWNLLSDSGGYTVQPVPTPASRSEERSRKVKEGTSNQKERLFIRGKAMSATPNMRGSNQFPKPPIEIGITIKKIITKA